MSEEKTEIKEIEQSAAFVDYLLSKGYPASSIILNYSLGVNSVDVVIIDPLLKSPTAAFELVHHVYGSGKGETQIEQALAMKKRFEPLDVPYYLVSQKPDDKFFGVFEVSERSEDGLRGKRVDRIEVPTYQKQKDLPIFESVLNETRSKAVMTQKRELASNLDIFTRLCWIFAFFSLAMFAFHLIGVIAFTSTELILFGLSIGLFLMPFLKKLKVPGFEWERDKE